MLAGWTHVILYLVGTVVTVGSTTPNKCPDGRDVLREATGSIWPCSKGCPKGFDCHFKKGFHNKEYGHCCLNMSKLSQLYGGVPLNQLEENPQSIDNVNKDLPAVKAIRGVDISSKDLIGKKENLKNEGTSSCERYPYRLSCNEGLTASKPMIRWYYNIQTLSCEFYPFGSCLDDSDPPATLKTKEECERTCDVDNLRLSLGKLQKVNSIESKSLESKSLEYSAIRDSIELPPPVAHRMKSSEIDMSIGLNRTSVATVTSEILNVATLPPIEKVQREAHFGTVRGNLAIDDYRSETRRSVLPEALTPRPLKHFPRNSNQISAELLITVPPTVRTTVVDESEGSGWEALTFGGHNAKILSTDEYGIVINEGNGDGITVADGTVVETSTELPTTEGFINITIRELETMLVDTVSTSPGTTVINDEQTTVTPITVLEEGSGDDVAQDDGTTFAPVTKSEKQIKEESYWRRQKELVVCKQTPYRLFCKNGLPAQFVYRWESVDGKCQSFPYGYCLYEDNIPHPRSQSECELYCNTTEDEFLLLKF